MAVCEFGDRLAYFILRPARLSSLRYEWHLNGFAVDEGAGIPMQKLEKARLQRLKTVFISAVVCVRLFGSRYHRILPRQ